MDNKSSDGGVNVLLDDEALFHILRNLKLQNETPCNNVKNGTCEKGNGNISKTKEIYQEMSEKLCLLKALLHFDIDCSDTQSVSQRLSLRLVTAVEALLNQLPVQEKGPDKEKKLQYQQNFPNTTISQEQAVHNNNNNNKQDMRRDDESKKINYVDKSDHFQKELPPQNVTSVRRSSLESQNESIYDDASAETVRTHNRSQEAYEINSPSMILTSPLQSSFGVQTPQPTRDSKESTRLDFKFDKRSNNNLTEYTIQSTSKGIDFVTELSNIIELDAGQHALLADIMDRQLD